MANTAGSSSSTTRNYDYLIKLLLIGDSGVGKSCCLLRFTEDSYTPSFITTIGIDFKIKTITIEEKKVKLQIWDTAGQERFRTITTAYYRGAMGILVVYDITDEKSYEHLDTWLSAIEQHASPEVVKILIGNKVDMCVEGSADDKRRVSQKTAKQFADDHGMAFYEVSAQTNENIEMAFFKIAGEIKKRLEQQQMTPNQGNTPGTVQLTGNQDNYSKCCQQ